MGSRGVERKTKSFQDSKKHKSLEENKIITENLNPPYPQSVKGKEKKNNW